MADSTKQCWQEEIADAGRRQTCALKDGEQSRIFTELTVTKHPWYNDCMAVWLESICYKGVLNETGEYGLKIKIGFCIAHSIDKPTERAANAFEMNRILHLDTVMGRAESRGTGLGAIWLDQFHSIVKQMPEPFALEGTVILSPARVGGQKCGEMSDYEVKSGLVEFSGKQGYEVLVRGDRKVAKAVSVMGRTI